MSVSDQFFTQHRELRNSAEHIVEMRITKSRPEDTPYTLFYERNGETVVFDIEAYGLLKERK